MKDFEKYVDCGIFIALFFELIASVAEWRKYELFHIFSGLSPATDLPIYMRQEEDNVIDHVQTTNCQSARVSYKN